MPKLLIVGSARDLAQLDSFRAVARDLGAAVAKRGHELVVCSHSDSTADRWAVEGANGASTPEVPAHVSYFMSAQELENAEDQPYDRQAFPNILLEPRLTHGEWFETYDAAARWCDGAIAIGGSSRGTGPALYLILARRQPVVAITSFGGAAKDIWRDTESHYNTLPAQVRLGLQISENGSVADTAIEAAEYLIEHSPFPRQTPAKVYLSFPISAALLLLGWLLLSFKWTATPTWKPYVVGAVTALAGILLRYAGDSARNREAYVGAARIYRDLARVLCLLLLASILIDWLYAQAGTTAISGTLLRVKLLAVVGFAAGFLVEDVSKLLTQTLTRVVHSKFEPKP
jgi:hypothetical protein